MAIIKAKDVEKYDVEEFSFREVNSFDDFTFDNVQKNILFKQNHSEDEIKKIAKHYPPFYKKFPSEDPVIILEDFTTEVRDIEKEQIQIDEDNADDKKSNDDNLEEFHDHSKNEADLNSKDQSKDEKSLDEMNYNIENIVEKVDVGSKLIHDAMMSSDYENNEKIEEEKKIWRDIVLISSIAISLIVFFIFIAKPYLRWLTHDPMKLKPADAEIDEFTPDFDQTGLKKIEVQEEVPFEKLAKRDQIVFLAKHEPMKTTEALRTLMSPGANK